MLYTALLFIALTAVAAGLKYAGLQQLQAWEWWQIAAPAAAMGAIMALIAVGSLIHAAINKAGWRDGGGTD